MDYHKNVPWTAVSRELPIWMLDPFELNKRVLGEEIGDVVAPSAPGANEVLAARIKKWLPERWSDAEIPEKPVAIYPTHITRRISNQKSCFTLHGKLEMGSRVSQLKKTHLSNGSSSLLMRLRICSSNFRISESMRLRFSRT